MLHGNMSLGRRVSDGGKQGGPMRVSAPTLFLATALGLLALSGCQGESKSAGAQPGAGGERPPSPVGVVEVQPEPFR